MRKILPVLMLALLFSCSREARRDLAGETVPQEELFTMQLGTMEDELNLFHLSQVPFAQLPRLFMTNGLFYISNGKADKITRFTSYGDVLTIYYDPETTPEPVIVNSPDPGGATVSNRMGYPLDFNALESFVVNSAQEILVVDRLPQEQWQPKPVGPGYNAGFIRRISRDGQTLALWGQEGVEGSPFPYVESLELSLEDQLAVVCRNPPEWEIFWFEPEGALLHHVVLEEAQLPNVAENQTAMLKNVVAVKTRPAVLLYVNYYVRPDPEDPDELEYSHTRIHEYDLVQKAVVNTINVFRRSVVLQQRSGRDSDQKRIAYTMIATDQRDNVYLKGHLMDNQYELVVLDPSGQVLIQARIEPRIEGSLYTRYYLSPEGILSALLVGDTGAKVVWWRFDAMLEEERYPNP